MSIAIIGGSGFANLDHFQQSDSLDIETALGTPSSSIKKGTFSHNGSEYGELYFLARHGEAHSIAPHNINYRANIDALSQLGVTKIIALAAVGGIAKNTVPGSLVMPEQILDYTYGREMTFFDQVGDVAHAEFTEPYSAEMRQAVMSAADQTNTPLIAEGTYAATQGPRFETAAEIKRYANDGATIVGMTAMPEAVLAREKGIAYITIASVVNFAAGVQDGVISHDEIHAAYKTASNSLYDLLVPAMKNIEETQVNVPDLIYA